MRRLFVLSEMHTRIAWNSIIIIIIVVEFALDTAAQSSATPYSIDTIAVIPVAPAYCKLVGIYGRKMCVCRSQTTHGLTFYVFRLSLSITAR